VVVSVLWYLNETTLTFRTIAGRPIGKSTNKRKPPPLQPAGPSASGCKSRCKLLKSHETATNIPRVRPFSPGTTDLRYKVTEKCAQVFEPIESAIAIAGPELGRTESAASSQLFAATAAMVAMKCGVVSAIRRSAPAGASRASISERCCGKRRSRSVRLPASAGQSAS
jgi:hypothetical protein